MRLGRLLVFLAPLLIAGIAAGLLLRPSSSTQPVPSSTSPTGFFLKATPDEPVPDPRLTFPSPFRNIKPDVQYVGDAGCGSCHPKIDKDYHAHPMGRSAEWTTANSPVEQYEAERQNPFTYGAVKYSADRDGEKVVHRLKLSNGDEHAFPVHLSIGSGTQGRSYIVCEEGSAWQTPVSWFTQDHRWDISPGYDMLNGGKRPVVGQCLNCHVNRVEPIPGSLNRYREPVLIGQAAIGCERCHGPAELHVRERTAGLAYEGIDTSIVNPKHLSPELKQDICRQCHLQGEGIIERRGLSVYDYRPGLPWEHYITIVQRHPDLSDFRKSVGHFEQMEKSKCYTASKGQLTCVTCHDPHKKQAPSESAAHYNARCDTCHQQRGCTAPASARQAQANSCIACHMAKSDSSSIVHASVHDHRIPRILGAPTLRQPSSGPRKLPVQLYRPGPHAVSDAERERDLGIALARLVRGRTEEHFGLIGPALERLQTSLKRWPGDARAWTSLARVQLAAESPEEALHAATQAIQLQPDLEEALIQVVSTSMALRKWDAAREAIDRLIRLNPRHPEYQLMRCEWFLGQERWSDLEQAAQQARQLLPTHPKALLMLAVARHKQGHAHEAEALARTAFGIARTTSAQSSLRAWYNDVIRPK